MSVSIIRRKKIEKRCECGGELYPDLRPGMEGVAFCLKCCKNYTLPRDASWDHY